MYVAHSTLPLARASHLPKIAQSRSGASIARSLTQCVRLVQTHKLVMTHSVRICKATCRLWVVIFQTQRSFSCRSLLGCQQRDRFSLAVTTTSRRLASFCTPKPCFVLDIRPDSSMILSYFDGLLRTLQETLEVSVAESYLWSLLSATAFAGSFLFIGNWLSRDI